MFTSALLAAAIAFTPADAKFAYGEAEGLVREHTPRNGGTIRARLAAGWLLDRVSRTGVDASLDTFTAATPDGERHFCNVMVELPGTETNAPWIVVMSHFDTAPDIGSGFQGANDGASTSGLLIALAAAIRRAGPQRDSIALVWTDGEECRREYGPDDGFQGSRRLVELFRERRRPVKCAICLDMLGDKDLNIVVPGNGEKSLRKIVKAAADRAGLGKYVTLCDDMAVKDDHQAFLDAGCSAVDIIDFDFGSAPGKNDYWHTPQDTLDKISEASLLVSGRIVAEMLNMLGTPPAQKKR